ncbi:arylsulfatase [Flammeovirga pectinis]|uniref:Arylsulfatase n=1 Tax=Flammeovirga pectinis TaxID=2494373 RepID=A0A3S9P8L1_9BACT|nr:arylsulfatase [Flammeovirga pectinis]AZQ64494.1 arylsulfatase [Flammeovirga pectinis]
MKITGLSILALLFVLIGCNNNQKKELSKQTKKPNILIILADDMGYGDIGAFGSEIQTPNIDKLANEGIQFTNFHVGAACSPTRTMLMTGVDNHRAGLGNMTEIQADNQFGKPGYEGYLNDDVVSVATRMQDGGYHTYMVGKWHLGHSETTIPHAKGFERSFALMESGADNWVEQPYIPMYKAVHYYEDKKQVSLPTENYFSSNYYTDKMMKYIGESKKDDKPFYAYLSYQAVHYPHQAPKEYIDKYNGVYDEGWEKLRENRLAKQKELGIVSKDVILNTDNAATTEPDWKIQDWSKLSDEQKKFNARKMQAYSGMVDNMDVNIGRLISYLKEIGEYDNTLIVFLSDNGADPNQLTTKPGFDKWYKANYEYTFIEDYKGDYSKMGLKGSYADYGPGWAAAANTPNSYYKTFSTEGGIRVPFVAWYPKVLEQGKMVNNFAFVKDLVPTMLEVAGIEDTGNSYNGKEIYPITGKSMWSFLTGKAKALHNDDEIIGYELAGSSAVFQGKYKLSINPKTKGTGKWELYDIVSDPSEMHNLASKKPKLVAKLKAGYSKYEKDNGVVPVPADYDVLKQLIKNAERGVAH